MGERIEQVFTAYGPLGSAFRKRIGLRNYKKNDHSPLLVFGCWGSQVGVALRHPGKVVIVWRGGDIVNQMRQHPDKLEELQQRKNIKHIAISSFIEKDMQKYGFDYKLMHIPAPDNSDITPAPLGDSIYIYKAKVYSPHIIDAVREAVTDIPFILCGYTTHDRQGILDVYRKCFMGIRPIWHDGLSNSVVEMGLMGRPYVWNGGLSNATTYETAEDIIKIIYDTYANRNNIDPFKIAQGVKDQITEDEFLNTNIWTWE